MNKAENPFEELKWLARCANIDNIDTVLQENLTMNELKEELTQKIIENHHKYKISYLNTNDCFYTYVRDETKKSKRRLVKRKNKDDLEAYLVSLYIDNTRKNITLQELFKEWMIYRRDETSAKNGTIRKNKAEWNTFLKGSILAGMKAAEIKPIDLIRFFRRLTKDRQYTRKCITNVRSLLNGIFSYAIEEEIITHNPILDVDFKKFTYKPVESQSDNVFKKEDVKKLLAHLRTVNEPYSLAIQLAFCLFIRIGELKALKWENCDVENRSIYLNSQITEEPVLNDDLSCSEKKIVVEPYIKGCTSHGFRKEYLTDNALIVLEKAKEINPDGKYVFMPYGRVMNTERFNIYLKRYCDEVNIPYYSSHAIRFYTASVAYNGDNLVTISKMMGHSQVSTTLHYLRDVIQDDDLAETFKNLG